MARYVYNREGVNSVIDQLETAINKIIDVNSTIQNGFTTIKTARGGEYINISPADALGYKDVAETAIRSIMADIREKASMIEEYNSASWLTKASATVAMAFSKFVEGFFTAGENILDGFASIGGLVVGIFSKDAQKSIGEFIAKDHIGDLYRDAYNGGILSGLEKYSAFSSESTAANVFKGFGVATGYAAAVVLTGAPASSLAANMGVAFIGGMGSGTQEGLQSGLEYDDAALHGAVKGGVQAGTVYAFSKSGELLGKGIQKVFGKPKISATPTSGNAPQALPPGGSTTTAIANSADDVTLATTGATANSAGSNAGMLDDLVYAGESSTGQVFDKVDVLNASGKVIASTYDDIATSVAGNTSLMNNAAPTTASATGVAPLGLPAGAEAAAALPAGAEALAPLTATSTELAVSATTNAATGLGDVAAATTKGGIPPVLSVAPQYMKGDTTAQETISDDLLGLGDLTAPTVDSKYMPSQPDVTPTPEPTVTPPEPDVTPTPTPTVTPSKSDVTPTPTPTVTPPKPDVTPTPTPTVTPSKPDVTPTPGPTVTPSQPDVTPTPEPTVTPSQPNVTPTPGPTVTQPQPISSPVSSVSEPTQPDRNSTVPIDKSSFMNIPNPPIYKHQQTIRNNNQSSDISKGLTSALVGLGIAGTAGAVGYGIYNKKKNENEDENEEEDNETN